MLIWNWAKLICEEVCTTLWNGVLKSVMDIWHSFRWSPQEHFFLQKVKPQLEKKQYSITFLFLKFFLIFFLIWTLMLRQDYKLWWKISKAELLSGAHKGFLSHNSVNRSIYAARIWTIRGSTDFPQNIVTVMAALCLGFIIWGICF